MLLIRFVYLVLVAGLLLLTLLPFAKVHHGSVRGAASPRLQYFWVAIALLIATPIIFTRPWVFWAAAALALTLIVNATYIAPFTRLWPTQSKRATAAQRKDIARHVSILAANVKKSNTSHRSVIDLVLETAPDIAILIEIDTPWANALEPLFAAYPHRIVRPQDNGYGIALLSRLPVAEHSVTCRVTEGVPSIRAAIQLPSGDMMRLYAVHPEPPTATHDTLGRDSEIAAVGLDARNDDLPAVVAGDLNDVAWSTTTRRFQRLSRLLDPRVGRGSFNTFHADYPMFRWPLDHLFHDARFRLVSMERGPHIGSDHFPILFRLALMPNPKGEDTLADPEKGEAAEARQMIAAERQRDRDPIGEDWE